MNNDLFTDEELNKIRNAYSILKDNSNDTSYAYGIADILNDVGDTDLAEKIYMLKKEELKNYLED